MFACFLSRCLAFARMEHSINFYNILELSETFQNIVGLVLNLLWMSNNGLPCISCPFFYLLSFHDSLYNDLLFHY